MSAPAPVGPDQPRRSALKADPDRENGERTPPLAAQAKAVQIVEPESLLLEDPQAKKQFSVGLSRRLSGRHPVPTIPSRSSTLSQLSMESAVDATAVAFSAALEEAQNPQAPPQLRHVATERLLSQVAEWLGREKAKREQKRSQAPSVRWKAPPSNDSIPVLAVGRPRSDSIESDSSEVSLDRLQRIVDDSIAALGLKSVPQLNPRLGRKHRKRSSRSLLRTASSDTEWFDGDVVVPTCEAVLDNSKTMAYTGGKAGTGDDSPSISGRKEEKERQNWITFKNEIIRLAHTLRLKGWRRVPLDSGETISVERLSGALTNAVYVVSPPSEALLPREPGKKQPTNVLLRIYGPQVEHLIDRENELGVLRRLARKKIGPRLLGTFLNGRFEQYLNAAPLTPTSMREPYTSRQIAKRMRELHEGVELLGEEKDAGPGVWKNWDKWLGQVEKTVLFLDRQVIAGAGDLPGGAEWKARGFVCGVPWSVFKGLVDKYRLHLEAYYGGAAKIREKLVFAHNDTQYGNILRVRPDDQKSPLLQPANEHKQLVVIDFEYAAANLPGLEFANHFSEWTYNYHDAARPYACDASRYPTVDEQTRFVKAYVDHRPQLPGAPVVSASPMVTPKETVPASSSSSIVDFMLDARVPTGGWKEEERKREEEAEGRVAALLEETRLWRLANSAMWVAWGIVQAKIPGLLQEGGEGKNGDGEAGKNGEAAGEGVKDGEEEEKEEEEEFDYLGYAQDRAYFFLGDCVVMGLVEEEALGEEVRAHLKVVRY